MNTKQKEKALKITLLVVGTWMLLCGSYILLMPYTWLTVMLIKWGVITMTLGGGFGIAMSKFLAVLLMMWGVMLLHAYIDPQKHQFTIYITTIFATLMALVNILLTQIPPVVEELNENIFFLRAALLCVVALILIFLRPRKEKTFLEVLKIRIKDLM